MLPEINQQSIKHILIYECNSDYKGDPPIPTGNCFTSNSYTHFCRKLINGWSVGGDRIFFYPRDAAHPLSSEFYSYLMIEIHYNNENSQVIGKLS